MCVKLYHLDLCRFSLNFSTYEIVKDQAGSPIFPNFSYILQNSSLSPGPGKVSAHLKSRVRTRIRPFSIPELRFL